MEPWSNTMFADIAMSGGECQRVCYTYRKMSVGACAPRKWLGEEDSCYDRGGCVVRFHTKQMGS